MGLGFWREEIIFFVDAYFFSIAALTAFKQSTKGVKGGIFRYKDVLLEK